jgi:hypothetical protein
MSYVPETKAAKMAVMGTSTQYTQDTRFSSYNDGYMYADANKSVRIKISGVSKLKLNNTQQSGQPGSSEYLVDASPSVGSYVNPIDYSSRVSIWRTSNTKFGGRTDARVPESVFVSKGCAISATYSSGSNKVSLIGGYCAVSMLPIGDNR